MIFSYPTQYSSPYAQDMYYSRPSARQYPQYINYPSHSYYDQYSPFDSYYQPSYVPSQSRHSRPKYFYDESPYSRYSYDPREAYLAKLQQQREEEQQRLVIQRQLEQEAARQKMYNSMKKAVKNMDVTQPSKAKSTPKQNKIETIVTDVYEAPYVSNTPEFCVDLTMSEEDRKKSYFY